MNSLLFIFPLLLLILELIYFKVATKYNIVDCPNHRSSHKAITIRGGGIIFSIALLLSPVFIGFQYNYFLIGLLLISLISFIDDVKTIGNTIRVIFHFSAAAFLFYQVGLYSLPYWLIALAFVFVIGIINAVNFMDGINGITGGYGFVALITLYYINTYLNFTSAHLLIIAVAAVLIFNFFNFRIVAKCFAGDVGSVGLAFIIIFFLLQLIVKTNNINYVLILLIYGLDTSTTMFFRIIRGENLSIAHRTHFYQHLTNERKIPHVTVALGYMFIQVIINILTINYLPHENYMLAFVIVISAFVFTGVRFLVEGYKTLVTQPN